MTAHPDVSNAPRTKATAWGPVVAGLLVLVLVGVALIAFNTHRLVIEQQRSTCFARMAWITPGDEEMPGGVERTTAARLCEGNSPLIEFQDGN